MARPGQMLLAALALVCLSTTVMSVALPKPVLKQFAKQTEIAMDLTEKNPYGLAAITFTKGTLKAGNLLVTNWNDADNNPGQGTTIIQMNPATGNGDPWAVIDPTSSVITAECGNFGVGLTMALVILSRGFVVVGSTPIPVGGTVAGPGCLILLDSNGNVLDAHGANELTSDGTLTGGGPWGMAVSEFNKGNQAYLFVSYVLGNNPKSKKSLTGLAGGKVVRYGVQVPAKPGDAPKFWGNAPALIAFDFATQPGNIATGAVGPSGLLVGKLVNGMSFGGALNKNQLFIANTLLNSITVVPQSTTCNGPKGGDCVLSIVAQGGQLSLPVGLGLSPVGTIVAANAGIGTLVEVAPTPNANQQLTSRFVDTTGGNGAGALFNVLFHPFYPRTLFFNNDALNNFQTLSS